MIARLSAWTPAVAPPLPHADTVNAATTKSTDRLGLATATAPIAAGLAMVGHATSRAVDRRGQHGLSEP